MRRTRCGWSMASCRATEPPVETPWTNHRLADVVFDRLGVVACDVGHRGVRWQTGRAVHDVDGEMLGERSDPREHHAPFKAGRVPVFSRHQPDGDEWRTGSEAKVRHAAAEASLSDVIFPIGDPSMPVREESFPGRPETHRRHLRARRPVTRRRQRVRRFASGQLPTLVIARRGVQRSRRESGRGRSVGIRQAVVSQSTGPARATRLCHGVDHAGVLRRLLRGPRRGA